MNRPKQVYSFRAGSRPLAYGLLLTATIVTSTGCQNFIFGRRADESKISVRKTSDRSWFNWFRSSRNSDVYPEYSDLEAEPYAGQVGAAKKPMSSGSRQGMFSSRLSDSGDEPSSDANVTLTGLRRKLPDSEPAPAIEGLSPEDSSLLERQMQAIEQRKLLDADPKIVSLVETAKKEASVQAAVATLTGAESGTLPVAQSQVVQASAVVPAGGPQVQPEVSAAAPPDSTSSQMPSATTGTSFRLSDSADSQPIAKPAPPAATPAPQSEQVAASQTAVPSDPAVVQASASTPINSIPPAVENQSWREHLHQAVVALEKDIAAMGANASDDIRLNHEGTLRLLYLSENRLDDALKGIETLQPHERDFFRYEFQALHAALDPTAIPVRSRRWSLVMHSQRQANNHLAAVSNLEILNLAFCSAVESYGLVTKFPKYQFAPEQELLLYCELENLAAEQIKDGFETELQGTYEIYNSSGVRVADQVLPPDKHVCRNFRRDYFIAYRVYLPSNLPEGKYELRLTIEDMKGHKFGQSSSDFQVKTP